MSQFFAMHLAYNFSLFYSNQQIRFTQFSLSLLVQSFNRSRFSATTQIVIWDTSLQSRYLFILVNTNFLMVNVRTGSRDTSRETSPNRGSGITSRFRRGSDRPPLSPATRPVLAQKILQQSREAENALADAFVNICLNNSKVFYFFIGFTE